jgi:hypothetical protein
VSASSSRARLGSATLTIVVSRLMVSAARHVVARRAALRFMTAPGGDVDSGHIRVHREVTAVNIV